MLGPSGVTEHRTVNILTCFKHLDELIFRSYFNECLMWGQTCNRMFYNKIVDTSGIGVGWDGVGVGYFFAGLGLLIFQRI